MMENDDQSKENKELTAAVKPVFLFSLPRSGSTLLQRLLGAHEEVATVSEPWILLPLLYTLRGEGVYAEYNYQLATIAIQDFCETLSDGREDYSAAIREFALSLYGNAAGEGSRYFLDKTPRYHLVVDEIISTFPEAKFIFLWRNPLAVVASTIETWARGEWNLYRHKVDLFTGLQNLTYASQQYEDVSCTVRYEDLVDKPENELGRIFKYLDLSFDPQILTELEGLKLEGRMGDRPDAAGYSHVRREYVDKWQGTLANPVRKGWCRSYLRWIGEERLSLMGYSLSEIRYQLDSVPSSLHFTGSDIVRSSYGIAYELLEPAIFKRKLHAALSDWRHVHAHR